MNTQNTITKTRQGFEVITLKVANMKKADEFTIYPYNGGDRVTIQSSKRFAQINIKTGKAVINKKGCDYANSIKLQLDPLFFEVSKELCLEFQRYFWENKGKDGGGSVISWEHKELFSN